MAGGKPRVIVVKADKNAISTLNQINASLGLMNKNVKSMSRSFGFLKNTAAGFMAYFGAREIVNMADKIQLTNDKLRAFEGSARESAKTMALLSEASKDTKFGLQSTVDGYLRLRMSTKRANISQEDTLTLLKLLQNSFRLTGSTAAEASAVLIQFSQGLSAGALQGQELRSVMEQNSILADIIIKNFGKAGESIFRTAEKGVITVEKLVPILKESSKYIEAQAKTLKITFGQALVLALDKVAIKLNEIATNVGAFEKLNKGLDFFLNNANQIFSVLGKILGFFIILKSLRSLSGFVSNILNPGNTKSIGSAIAMAIKGFKDLKLQASIFLQTAGGVSAFFSSLPRLFSISFLQLVKGVTAIKAIKTIFTLLRIAIIGSSGPLGVFVSLLTTIFSSEIIDGILYLYRTIMKVVDAVGTFISKIGEIKDASSAWRKNVEENKISFSSSSAYKDERIKFISAYIKKQKEVIDNQKAITDAEEFNKGAFFDTPFFKRKQTQSPSDFLKNLGMVDFGEKESAPKKAVVEPSIAGVKKDVGKLYRLNNDLKSSGIRQYALELNSIDFKKINDELSDGKISIFEFDEAISQSKIKNLNAGLILSEISAKDAKQAFDNISLKRLNDEALQGSVTLAEYNQKLLELKSNFDLLSSKDISLAFSVGATKYLESLGTLGTQVADSINGAFKALEDNMVTFVTEGKRDFADFTNFILKELTRIAIRQTITAPLANIVSGFLPSLSGAASSPQLGASPASSGSGGYLGGNYSFKGMSDAGSDQTGANQGIKVNVFNSNNSDVQAKKTQNQDGSFSIDLIIRNKVAESLASGAMDGVMMANYGLKRRGV